jgi:putative membrane protein
MKLTTKSFITCVGLSLVLLSCEKDDEDTNVLNDTDRTFIMQASLSNSAEVGAGALAATMGEDAMIQSFAQMMVSGHTTAQSDLKATGNTVGVNVKDTIDAAHITLMQTLQGITGRAFDSSYIVNQITNHQKTVQAFQTELNSGSRNEVEDYANNYLPKIQMHLQRADSIATAMGFK